MEPGKDLIRFDASAAPQPLTVTLRRASVIASRQRRIAVVVFAAVVLGAVIAGLSMPKKYEAEMEILVLNNRAEPSVSVGLTGVSQPPDISEEMLNSEMELLRSRDLLEKVALACDLEDRNPVSLRDRLARLVGRRTKKASNPEELAEAVSLLTRNLKVQTMTKTDMIRVTYRSVDPTLSVQVLKILGDLYIEKHIQVHKIRGASNFFAQETALFHNQLLAATGHLAEFTSQYQLGSASGERDQTDDKLVGFAAAVRQAQADVRSEQRRIATLESEIKTTPSRMPTEERRSDNPELLEKMKSSLLEKRLQRAHMAATFNASYPPLIELNAQIAQIERAIQSQQKMPVSAYASNATPAHTYLMQELAKTRADLASSIAQAAALSAVVRRYRDRVSDLEQRTLQEQSLERDVKTAEANYLLYQHKLEDSRISQALDRRNISNVSIAEPPEMPMRPSNLGLALIAAIGVIVATLAAAGAALVVDSLANTFRTSEEVETLLGIPVLALLSKPALER